LKQIIHAPPPSACNGKSHGLPRLHHVVRIAGEWT
jgi:hypothetical protein